MEWKRGEIIGKGSFNSVYLATSSARDHNEIPPLMAVKSALVSQSSLLQKEKEILTLLRDCPQILHCFGEDYTVENGENFYNLILEFASRGNLTQLLKHSGGLAESDVRCYTKSILLGLRSIHEKNYVHCDIKSQNILVFGSTEVKIADFGLAKKAGQRSDFDNDGFLGLRGTPLYMSPESISFNEQEPPTDIWALGCVVLEMITGKTAWTCGPNADVGALLFRIGFGEELPQIPRELSEEAKGFLKKCFVKDPKKRWTAEMLLNHPFVRGDDHTVPLLEKEIPSFSPTSAFDFPEWCSKRSSDMNLIESPPSDGLYPNREFDRWNGSNFRIDGLGKLVSGQKPNWSSTDGWVTVREAESEVLKKEDFKRNY